MHTIHKFDLNKFPDTTRLTLTRSAEILDAQFQAGKLRLWAKVNTQEDAMERRFLVTGTGQNLNGYTILKFIATVQEGEYVWHVFEIV